jgi:hypothetical protein
MKSYLRLAAIVTALSLPAAGAAFADEASAKPAPAGATDTSKPALKKVAKGAKKKTDKKAPAKDAPAPTTPAPAPAK